MWLVFTDIRGQRPAAVSGGIDMLPGCPHKTAMTLPPGPRSPAFFQTARWLLDPIGGLEELGRIHGDIFRVKNLLFGDEVILSHPRAIKQVLTGDPAVYNAGEANAVLGAFLGDRSMLLLDGEVHLRHRRLIQPSFHGERMQTYTAIMREAALAALTAWHPGDQVGIYETMQRVTLEIILRAVLGLEGEAELAPLRAQLSRVLHVVQSPTGALWMLPSFQKDLGPLTPWASIKRELASMDAMLFAHIAQRRERGAGGADVLSMMLAAVDEQGEGLTDKELRDELVTLLMAGHETTAISIAWAFEELLRAPGEQDRLRAEVASVTAGAPVAAQHVPRFERLDSVLKEALRLHPVTTGIGRRLKQAVTIDGYDIPAGFLVVPCMHLTHRRPDLYPEPERFVAERFIGKKTDPYEWLPFGGGIRRCVGMAFALHEMRVVMAVLVSRAELRLAATGPYKSGLRTLFAFPKGGTQVVVERLIEAPAAA
jgi:cytochrome P450